MAGDKIIKQRRMIGGCRCCRCNPEGTPTELGLHPCFHSSKIGWNTSFFQYDDRGPDGRQVNVTFQGGTDSWAAFNGAHTLSLEPANSFPYHMLRWNHFYWGKQFDPDPDRPGQFLKSIFAADEFYTFANNDYCTGIVVIGIRGGGFKQWGRRCDNDLMEYVSGANGGGTPSLVDFSLLP